MDEQPDCYLASAEGYALDEPRRVWGVKRVRTADRDDLLLARIDPPLTVRNDERGDHDIDFVLLATRHQGASLFPINDWPLHVHLARFLIANPQSRDVLRSDEFESIAWAELYRTEEDARPKAI